jgi:hypothetical protein
VRRRLRALLAAAGQRLAGLRRRGTSSRMCLLPRHRHGDRSSGSRWRISSGATRPPVRGTLALHLKHQRGDNTVPWSAGRSRLGRDRASVAARSRKRL